MPTYRGRHRVGWLVAALLVASLVAPPAARADTVLVDVLTDDGPGDCSARCTLRDALDRAPDGATIRFGAVGTIVLRSPLRIAHSITIQGPMDGSLVLDGNRVGSVIEVADDDAHVTLAGLTIRNGDAISGGAIADRGSLVVT